ncbi:MAG: IPTL-CTERM sorting domain-containing protein [Xanthomonadales bacterium]|nr:IPTL-CTERM sorting domain-containing protein [Xanthomonadales bacterium]
MVVGTGAISVPALGQWGLLLLTLLSLGIGLQAMRRD